VEPEDQDKEYQDEGLLEPNAGHVNSKSLELLLYGRGGSGHRAARELDNESGDVEEDENGRDGRGIEPEDRLRRDEVVYHSPHDHVGEGVDP
jgi:hypothetical protein